MESKSTNKLASKKINSPWSEEPDDVLRALEVDPKKGLSNSEVKKRLQEYGNNTLRKYKSKSVWKILVEQFAHIIIGLLVAAAIVSFVFGHITEGIAIGIVIVINAAIGFVMEFQAVRSMESLRELGTAKVNVKRGGDITEISAENLVPGDIVQMEGGDMITADIRILHSSKLQANESPLTGESMPVSKSAESVPEETNLAERKSMLYKGTSISRGSGEGVVVTTGMNTELGNISRLVEEAEEEQTPLEKRLSVLGSRLVWVTLVIAIVIFAMGYISGLDLVVMIETAIALAVATVPEGLPVVATIALARGMWRMVKRNALVKRLAAVETLGATDVICTDKTGTLTENRMTVREIRLPGQQYIFDGGKFEAEQSQDDRKDELLKQILRASVLCNNANYKPEEDSVGDPLEIALLQAADEYGIQISELQVELPEELEDAFDPETKRMGVLNKKNDGYLVSVKGAPEVIIDICTQIDGLEEETFTEKEKEEWHTANKKMAEDGLRVIAVAGKEKKEYGKDLYKNLHFYGLIGMTDPARKDVKPALDACMEAGVKVVMVTGDQSITAKKIALATGLISNEEFELVEGKTLKKVNELSEKQKNEILGARIFYRVNPEQKLNLISIYQKEGSIVAMTGDGVNDAPALKKADIGVSMGKRGTQVAKEAADIVLLDDAFSTIVHAVREGRVIFGNIRKFVLYLLSCNISEILAIGIASVIAFLPLPILPLQILFLNLVTDVFPALALGVGEGDKSVMQRPPRDPRESILTQKHWWAISGYGLMLAASVIGALYYALFVLEMPKNQAVTISFLTMAFSQLWHVFNMRGIHSGMVNNEITRNAWVWGALLLCTVLLIGVVYTPGISGVMQLVDPGYAGWSLIAVMSLLPLVVGQINKLIAHLMYNRSSKEKG